MSIRDITLGMTVRYTLTGTTYRVCAVGLASMVLCQMDGKGIGNMLMVNLAGYGQFCPA